MKKSILKISIIFAAMVLLTAMFSLAATAEILTGNCGAEGDNVTYTLDTETGVLNINGTGTMTDFSSSSAVPWYSYRGDIKTVTVGNGVTSFGSWAFCNCTSIENVYYTGDLAGWCNINFNANYGTPMFYGANLYINNDLLENAVIPDTVTSIAKHTFRGCESLKTVTIHDRVTKMDQYAFHDCINLANITIPDSVVVIGYHAFSGCASLETIVIPDSVVVIIDYSFNNCSSLESIFVDENNPNYCSFDGILYNKSKTTLIQAPGAITACNNIPDSVTSIGVSAFRDCTSLESITIPDGVTSIGDYAFSGCSSLTNITIPDGVTSIGSSMFRGCSSITNIVIPDSVTIIGVSAFRDCTSLESITIPDGVTSIDSSVFRGCSSFTNIVIPDSVTSIGYDAFASCSSLTSVEIPDSVTSIGNYAFEYCTNLASITIPDSVTSISQGVFWYCTSLASITIPDSVTIIGRYAFRNCKSLASITIPDSVTTIGDGAFQSCTKLTSMTIPDSVTAIGYDAFLNCHKLTDIRIGNSVTSIGDDVFSLCESLEKIYLYRGSYAEEYCLADTTLAPKIVYLEDASEPDYGGTCGDNLTWKLYLYTGELVISGTGAMTNYSSRSDAPWYSNCSYVKTVKIGDSVTSIGDYAFFGCSSLTSVVIGNSVTSIGTHAFLGCKKLTSVNIPDSVTSIGLYAFSFCECLASITIGNSVTSIGNWAFSRCCSLTAINVDDANTAYCDIDGVLLSKDEKNLIAYPCAGATTYIISNSVTSICEDAFSGCGNLTSVEIPDSVTSIGNSAFYDCSSLINVEIPNSVIRVGEGAFSGCSSLTSVEIPDSVSNIGKYAFDRCTNLKEIYVVKGSYAEEYCLADPSLAPYVRYKKTVVEKIETVSKHSLLLFVKDIKTGESIEEAEVTLGTQTIKTTLWGIAAFNDVEDGTYTIKITADGYEDYCDDSYEVDGEGLIDFLLIRPTGFTGIIPGKCNGINIGKKSAIINKEADLYAKISFSVDTTSEIVKYQIKQENEILGESADGKFSIKNSKFEENALVVAYAYDKTGKEYSDVLNIDVISVGFFPVWFLDFDETITTPADVQIFNGLQLELETKKDTENKIEFEIENDKIKIGYNHEVAGKDLKKIENDLNGWLKKRYSDYAAKTAKLEFDVAGYVIVNLGNTGGVEKVTAEIYLVGKFNVSVQKTIIAFSVPVDVEISLDVSGTIKIKTLGYDFENGTIVLPAFDFTVKGEVTGKAGIGGDLASAGIYGKLGSSLDLKILPNFMVDAWKMNGEFGLYGKVLCLKADFPLVSGELVLYDKDRRTYSMRSSYDLYNEENYVLVPRSSFEAGSGWSEIANGVLDSSVDQVSNAQIVRAGETIMMVYVSNDGDDEYNYNQIVYSVYTDSGWSEPCFVDGGILADLDFDLYSDGENIWLAYTQANRKIGADDNASNIAAALEIAVTKFNASTGKFETPVVLTNNSTMDSNAQIAVVNGTPVIFWVNNADNNIFGMTENNTIFMSRYAGGAWSAPVAFDENVPAVVALDAGLLDGKLCVSVICDADSDFNTSNDSVLTVYNDAAEAYSYDSGNYENVQFAEGLLYWYNDGSIYSVDAYGVAGNLISNQLTHDSAADFEVISSDGEKYILYRVYNTEGEHGGCDIYAIINDGTKWSAPVRLTTTDGYVDSFDAIFVDGSILSVYRRTTPVFSETSIETYCELCSMTISPAISLKIENIDFSDEDLFDDDKVTLKVTVANHGIGTANGFTLSAGSATKVFDTVLAPGAATEVEIEYSFVDQKDPTVTVTDENGGYSIQIADVYHFDFETLAEINYVGKKCYLNTIVCNNGNLGGKGTFYARRDNADGEVIYSEEMELDADGRKAILLEIMDKTISDIYTEFVPEDGTDYFEEDNSKIVSISYRTLSTPGDLNGDTEVNAIDAVMLAQKIAGWDVELDETAADCNGDGEVNAIDAVLLAQFIADWDVVLG